MKKMVYILIAILIFLMILVITGRKSVHHDIDINATPEEIWKVLTQTDKYSEWNPTMQLLEGEIKEGNKVKYRFTQDASNQSDIGATVVQIIPNKLLNQKGGMPLVLSFNHRYMLEAHGTQTKVTIHEDYRGIGVNFWNPKEVEKAYGKLNSALKVRSETSLK